MTGILITGPYKPLRTWVDDHPLLNGNNESLDSSNARRSDPHCENAPDTGGGVKSPIKQISYAYMYQWELIDPALGPQNHEK